MIKKTKDGGPTPGPWHWEVEDASMITLCGPEGQEQHVVSMTICSACSAEEEEWKWGRCYSAKEPDARLIAAAPALLEACKKCYEWARSKRDLPRLRILHRTIALAEGKDA